REFVRSGGGYIGICAGAFLATARYKWSLGLVNCKTLTGDEYVPGVGIRSMAEHGVGLAKIQLTPEGIRIFPSCPQTLDVQYLSGPILSPASIDALPDYVTLAEYRSEVCNYEPQRGTMLNTPAIVGAQFGKGRLIAFSPHPELGPSPGWLVTRAAR